MQQCPLCFEKSVIRDSDGACSKLVCVECGAVLAEQTITSYTSDEGTTLVPVSGVGAPGKAKNTMKLNAPLPEGLTLGKRRIREICAVLSFTQDRIDAAMALYESLYHRPEIKGRPVQFKMTVALCVVYIICRQYGYVITIRDMVSTFHEHLEDFSKVYSVIRKIGNVNMPSQSLSSLTTQVLSRANFSFDLITRTQKILEIFNDNWDRGSGLHQNLVTAAAYLSWTADHMCDRKRMTLKSFCQKFNLQFSGSCRQKVDAMMTMLEKLATAIPWVDTTAGSDVGLLYLGDIIKYHRTLHSQQKINDEKDKQEGSSESLDVLEPPVDRNLSPNLITSTEIPDQGTKRRLDSAEESSLTTANCDHCQPKKRKTHVS